VEVEYYLIVMRRCSLSVSHTMPVTVGLVRLLAFQPSGPDFL
jgi:hypothetical protein